MKSKIIDTSILLFEKNGFSQTSIQDIVDALGVTKGTFYYYFSSKEELLMDIHLQYIDDLLGRQALIIEGAATCREKIEAIIQLLISDIKTIGPSARVFFRELRHLNGDNVSLIKKKRTEFRLQIEHLLSEGIKKGEFKPTLKADIVAFGILGVTNWSYQWYHPGGKLSDKELSAIFTDMILNGIAQ